MQRRTRQITPIPLASRTENGILRRAFTLLAVLAIFLPATHARAAKPEHRHAVLKLRGDLDSKKTYQDFSEAFKFLAKQSPRLIVIELSGNRARPDLLFETIRLITNADTPVAVWLADPADRRVGPGMLGIALAAQHAGIHPSTTIKREPGDSLTTLNPDIGDWALVNLDLRSAARDLAESTGLDQLLFESALAPRSPLWITPDETGSDALSSDEPPDALRAHQLVKKNADGWSFELSAQQATSLYPVALHRTPRAFTISLGLRSRPLETIEIESELRGAHERCLSLIRDTRIAVSLATAALDIRAGRAATTRIMAHEYHAAAEKAAPLVEQSRDAIALIAGLTGDYPEILRLPPPPDADAPTQIGGPVRTSLSAWRDAVRDVEYGLSRLDTRIETYRRR